MRFWYPRRNKRLMRPSHDAYEHTERARENARERGAAPTRASTPNAGRTTTARHVFLVFRLDHDRV
jgi:hypothetical protein